VFVAQPETDDHAPAGLLDLGARVKLVYLDAAAGDALAEGEAP
jgi:hypothetical protein